MQHAKTQFTLSASDLQLVLALARTGKLALAADRLALDTSTIFRSLQRIERGLGQSLFERSRQGYGATALGLQLAEQGEVLEQALEEARSALARRPEELTGTVRVTSTDTLMHGLVLPVLPGLRQRYPALTLDLITSNESLNLTRRDADLALRATRQPPGHLIGKNLGAIRVAAFGARRGPADLATALAGGTPWVAPDEALPEHPSVTWRKRHHPAVAPAYLVGSILTVAEVIEQGLAVGLLPLFLGQSRPGLRQLSDELHECRVDLWLLAHPEARHQRRIAAVYNYLAEQLALN